MSSQNLSGMRYKPSLELLQKVVDIFLPKQKITESFDIYLNRINSEKVIDEMMLIFPEIEMIYFPSKLHTMICVENKKSFKSPNLKQSLDDGSVVFNFETTILILRQFLRAHNYIVKTKTIKRKDTINRILSVMPPEHIVIAYHQNIIHTHSDIDDDDESDDDNT